MYSRRVLGLGLFVLVGCATGGLAVDDDGGTGNPDSGGNKDSGSNHDTGTPYDSGGYDQYTSPDVNTTPCGGACLGIANTCCSNMCVDTTSDPNNCGGCGTPCGSESCCSSSCVDTMGSDNNNCGGCGVICAGTCTGGSCMTTSTCTDDLGSCSHSPCVAGSALTAGCDPDEVTLFECVYIDPTCCSTSWSASCVSDAINLWGETCSDPGCM